MAEGPEDQTGKPTQQDQASQVQGIALNYDEVKAFLGELCLLIIGARSHASDMELQVKQAHQAVFALTNRVRALEGGHLLKPPADPA